MIDGGVKSARIEGLSIDGQQLLENENKTQEAQNAPSTGPALAVIEQRERVRGTTTML